MFYAVDIPKIYNRQAEPHGVTRGITSTAANAVGRS